jgi:hypothetical protein
MIKRFEGLNLPELEAALDAKKKQYENAFNEGMSYNYLIDLYKEIKLLQHQIMLKKVHEVA